jgi:uncharacterized damage-inducible protein DinB
MRSPFIAALALCALALPAAGQTLQEELIGDLENLRSKYVGLAEAVPESDYSWRPGEGVRSIVEVYMHAASANFRFPQMRDVQPPAGTSQAWIMGGVDGATRASVVEALNASFAHLTSFVEGVDDLDAPVTLFGRQTNVRGFLMLTQTHLHEHLGQSIAYARMRGVTPPWSM